MAFSEYWAHLAIYNTSPRRRRARWCHRHGHEKSYCLGTYQPYGDSNEFEMDGKRFGWRKTKDVFITDPSRGGCIGNSMRLLKPSGAGSSSAYRIRGGPKQASTIFEPCEGHLSKVRSTSMFFTRRCCELMRPVQKLSYRGPVPCVSPQLPAILSGRLALWVPCSLLLLLERFESGSAPSPGGCS